jgi:hypothetical protein
MTYADLVMNSMEQERREEMKRREEKRNKHSLLPLEEAPIASKMQTEMKIV